MTIVEPEGSWFDFKLSVFSAVTTFPAQRSSRSSATTYLTVAAFLGGASYFLYLTYFPSTRSKRSKRVRPAASAPVSNVTVTSSGARYEEEWIPEHHLKKPKARKLTTVSSGEELSGGETSGAEAKRRKGRK